MGEVMQNLDSQQMFKPAVAGQQRRGASGLSPKKRPGSM